MTKPTTNAPPVPWPASQGQNDNQLAVTKTTNRTWDIGTRFDWWTGGGRGFVVYLSYWVVRQDGMLAEIKQNHITFLEKDIDQFESLREFADYVLIKIKNLIEAYDAHYAGSLVATRLGVYLATNPPTPNLSRNHIKSALSSMVSGYKHTVTQDLSLYV